jgi:CheY-like chemotaxis protein
MLAVSDTGIGMDAETQAHIFEPFFTTKDSSKGTGLGLATVYGIVKQSEGNIWVYSEPGQGTTVRVYFPRSVGTIEGPAADIAEPSGVGGDETILVVEDEEILRGLLEVMLTRLGYQVRIAPDATTAIEIVRSTPIDVVITDVIMPGRTGPELALELRAQAPNLPILFMSGYSAAAIQDRGHLGDAAALIEKPFTAETLGRAIRRALAARPRT